MNKFVLASKSVDRKKLFERLRIPFEILITEIKEDKFKRNQMNPIELVKELAKVKALKAKEILLAQNAKAVIIAADTIVEFEGKLIGKADSNQIAFKILKQLSGKTHNLITGIAITETDNPKLVVDYDCTIIKFSELTKEEIENYLKTNEWKGRAGAYSITDRASLFIESIQGSPSNVIGLPVYKMYKILKDDFNMNLLSELQI